MLEPWRIASSCISTTDALGLALGQQLGGEQSYIATALAADIFPCHYSAAH
jgi:hypothetical protein